MHKTQVIIYLPKPLEYTSIYTTAFNAVRLAHCISVDTRYEVVN